VKSLALLSALMLLAVEARAEKRFALVVGANQGKPGQQQDLRYAEDDARRVGRILGSVGRFHPANVIVLTDVTADSMREALSDLERRIAETQDSLLFVFYSGHADGTALNLGRSRFPLDELRDHVVRSSAAARILVIDACKSGVLTRVKGGWPGPAFEVPEDQPVDAEGIAILASSAAGEEAQESEELEGSFFTHYFASGLLGAADRNGDLEVTLGETFTYAAERTLAATNATVVGPQHPTYRVELRGRDDIVLTSLAGTQEGVGTLQFVEAGGYLVQEAEGENRTVAEVALSPGQVRRLAVGSGRYRVTRRAPDHLLAGDFDVSPSSITEVRESSMDRIAYARMVRKGATNQTAMALLALGGVRSSVNDGGVAWQVGAGARFDLEELSLEARVDVGGASATTDAGVRTGTRELSLSLVGVRAFDVGPLTLSLGLELGGVWFNQRFAEERGRTRNSFAGLGGPLGMIELPIDQFAIRLEVALPIYLLRGGNDADEGALLVEVSYRAGIGFGLYF
jgi:hypothetical protein